jgi:hypothetical protein
MTPKSGIVELVETAVASKQLYKHVSAATDMHAAIEELLAAVFSMRFVLLLYKKDERESRVY